MPPSTRRETYGREGTTAYGKLILKFCEPSQLLSPDTHNDRRPRDFRWQAGRGVCGSQSDDIRVREAKLAILAIRCNGKLLSRAMCAIAGCGTRGTARSKRITGNSRASFRDSRSKRSSSVAAHLRICSSSDCAVCTSTFHD